MTEIFVRPGRESDADLCRSHLRASLQEAARYRGEPWNPRVDAGAELVFVAGVGDTVFASITAHESEPRRWWISHVFVEEAAREVGLGDALMRALLSALSERGATFVSSSAQPGDRSLKNLFERHGLVARTILVGRDLSGPSSGEDVSR